ncbi:MAG: hypothetical protein QM784_37345 [Polyangiaceae bacterium]
MTPREEPPASEHREALVSGFPGSGPVTPAVVRVIDERPIGGASLEGSTSGGGTYADALDEGRLHYVLDVEGIRALISSNTPAILLIAEGTYDFGATATKLIACSEACDAANPLAKQNVGLSSCASGATQFEVDDTHEVLHVGSNKTVIGLGKGAILRNAELSLADASNVILRNLSLVDNNSNVVGQGNGIMLTPASHVWIDHCTFRNDGRWYVSITSDLDEAGKAVLKEAGYVTLTYNLFDGMVEGICRQRSQYVFGTRRNPALTFAYNWFYRSENRNPFLFGPETWAHIFNNYWSDVSYAGVAAACGAAAVLQGNAFAASYSALSINDNGVTDTPYCAANPWGKVYAPMNTGTDEDNRFDSTSTLALHDQPTDGTGMTKPSRRSGHVFTVTAPTKSGTSTEIYEVTLFADPATVASEVKAKAGAGKLF